MAIAAALPVALAAASAAPHRHPVLPLRPHAADLASAQAGPPPNTPGAVGGLGSAVGLGAPGKGIAAPLVGMAPTPSGHGYWLAAADGGIFAYGDAGFYGSLGDIHLHAPIVGIAPTPSGHGYWLVAADGGIFAYGDAGFYGSLGDIHLHAPIVGIAPTPSGHGYWLVAADGGIFAYGDAGFYGSLGDIHLHAPIVGIAPTPSGHGYWLVAADGGIFAYGDAGFYGSLGDIHLHAPIVGIAPTPSGHGYWLAAADGGIFAYGDAGFYGSLAPESPGTKVVGVAAGPGGGGYWTVTAPSSEPQSAGSSEQAASLGTPIGTFVVTCYDLEGTTASGAPTGPTSVAVDPSVIPLGSHIYVDGAGARVADDTGGAIVGHRLDIWEPTAADCSNWGVEDQEVYMQG